MLFTATLVVNHNTVLVVALTDSNRGLLNILALDLVSSFRLGIDDTSSRVILLARCRLSGRRDTLLVPFLLDLAHIVRVGDESEAACGSSTAACRNLRDSLLLKVQSVHILLCSRLLLDLLLNDIALVLINGSLNLSRAVLTEIDDRLFLRLRI